MTASVMPALPAPPSPVVLGGEIITTVWRAAVDDSSQRCARG
jgi:hypothetical protein